MCDYMDADDIEALDSSDVDWKATAEALQAEVTRLRHPGMTAGELAPLLPEHLRHLYWHTKIAEVVQAEPSE